MSVDNFYNDDSDLVTDFSAKLCSSFDDDDNNNNNYEDDDDKILRMTANMHLQKF